MAFLAFLGCDGSGKSAVIERVSQALEAEGVALTRGHWRPKAFSAAETDHIPSADDPHGQASRGTLSSIAKLGWLWCNWWVGWLRGLGNARKQGVLLFDRYHADLLVDPRRYRYGGPRVLARWASHLMPQPDLAFFLDAPPEVLLGRKNEVDLNTLSELRKGYLELCASHSRINVIDANRTLDEVVQDVLTRISRESANHNHPKH